MWNPNAVDNRHHEKRVVVGRVRPTWARNLPEGRNDEEKEQEGVVMPHSDPPSPSDWDQHKQEDKYDAFGKVMLLGDSGVGKTCMLVRFRDGTFLAGNYISTVGIDFRNKIVTVDGIKVKLQIWDTAGQERFRSVTHAYYRDAHVSATGALSLDPFRPPDARTRRFAETGSRHVRGAAISCLVVVDHSRMSLLYSSVRRMQLEHSLEQFRGRAPALCDEVALCYFPTLLLLYDVTNKTSFDNIRAWLGEIREYAQDDVVIMLLDYLFDSGNKSDSGLERAVRREEGQRLAREYQVAFMETSAKTGLNVEAAFAHVARALVARADHGDPARLAVRAQPAPEQKSSCPPCT
ncbi:Ras-related protein Rab-26 [Eumeta japonica]|uniref:Ras-related protein Rab-26 n=1 Tax=Eumeta variegata TaxID=151549 RepID=A0A4C1ZH17_EUMVA|nr:Ras-related protein Rab-26 [Eumeta japonica]